MAKKYNTGTTDAPEFATASGTITTDGTGASHTWTDSDTGLTVPRRKAVVAVDLDYSGTLFILWNGSAAGQGSGEWHNQINADDRFIASPDGVMISNIQIYASSPAAFGTAYTVWGWA